MCRAGAKWCDGGHLWRTRNWDQRLVYEVEDSWWRELFEKVLALTLTLP